MRKYSFEAIGTKWSIEVFSQTPDSDWVALQAGVANQIEEFDRTYSRFRDDSWVTKLSKKAGTYVLPNDALPLMEFYRQLYDTTEGLVTPLIGKAISDAGYDAQYSLTSKVLSKPPEWQEIIQYSQRELTMKRPALLDFGAAGKGYLIDIIGQLLNDARVMSFVINAGGDILYRSKENRAIEIGLENPYDTSEVIGTVRITNQSLCASAGNRRSWGKYHHIISPKTLESPQDITATWVVADTAMHADGLATALFFVEPEKLLEAYGFEYAILNKDMELQYSKDLNIRLFGATA